MITKRRFLQSALGLLLTQTLSGCEPSTLGDHAKSKSRRSDVIIGWTSYAGWVPWEYAERAGIVKKWADRYKLNIKFVQYDDYLNSIALYSEGKIHGVTATLGDALISAHRDNTVVIAGDYSNGNDGICSKTASTLAEIRDQPIYLAESSVSQYLLERALELSGFPPQHRHIVDTSDNKIVSTFFNPRVQHVATWNPHLEELRKSGAAKVLFDSSRIPGEIMDVLIVDTNTLRNMPALGRALINIWYETLGVMLQDNLDGKHVRSKMADLLGVSAESFEAQLETTFFFPTLEDASRAISGEKVKATIRQLLTFAMRNNLLEKDIRHPDDIGFQFDDQVLGNPNRMRLRFDTRLIRSLSRPE